MYYNFGDIKFRCDNATNGVYNQGWYTSITNGEKYDSNIEKTERQTATQLFVKQGISNGVRILTLPEINRALGRKNLVAASSISDAEDQKGIYKLTQLKKAPKIDTINYTSGSAFVSSPVGTYAGVLVMLWTGSYGETHEGYNGVRPVVSIQGSNFRLEPIGDEGTYRLVTQ